MPTTYTHDLFGKRVCRKLPEKLQHLIRSNGNLYRRTAWPGYSLLLFYIKKSGDTVWSKDAWRKSKGIF